MTVGERIKEIRKEKGISQNRLAKKAGIGQSTLSAIESTTQSPGIETIQLLANALRVTPSFLMGEEEQTHDKKWIPVLGNVVAGLPTEAIENFDDDWEELSEDMMNDGYEYFALRIKGDSMSPRMQNGDVVIVRKQSDIETDEIAVVKVDGEDATVKKVRLTDDGIWLLPSNPAYEPMYYSRNEEISVLGKVVELRAKF